MADNEKSRKTVATSVLAPGAVAAADQVPRERAHFRALIVANPNYFGNVADSPFPPVIGLKGNTTYEEIKCAGFHPQHNRLDAVVFVKQPFGYGGGICAGGTQEYVRFYLSFDNGATWVDQGLTSFTAHDVPSGATGGKRLEYAVSLPSQPPRKWCTVPNIIRARAILSWNAVPPPDSPHWTPVWGNVHDTRIQVDPRWLIKWVDILKIADVTLTPVLAQSIDLDQEVEAAAKKALTFGELQDLYRGKGVEPHRYAMAEIKQLIKTPELAGGVHPLYLTPADKLGFKLADVIGTLLSPDGSTVYEELDCVGLRSNGMTDELVGVLRIKRSSGFSGGPCTQGSREYVTFWADFDNNGDFGTCLGTASVQVFDLEVPPDGLEYSVRLPVNLNPYRRPCDDGPRVVPIRAILSWNDVPECGNPNWIPTWGNREETLILIPPGQPVTGFAPFLHEVSGAAVCAIDQGTGLAAGNRPFGGRLCITGSIPGALTVGTPDTLEYKIWATQGPTTIPIVSPFSVVVHEGTGPGTAISYSIAQNPSPDGYFIYREHGTPALSSWREVTSPERLLARWNTEGLTGNWTIHIQARVVGTVAPIYAAGVTTCLADGTTRSSVVVSLDQDPPVADVAITGYSDATGFHPAVPCGDFDKGVTIHGTFDITDNRGVGPFSLALEPSGSVTVVVDPSSTATHVFGTWTVATGGLPPCGYVVHLTAWDRAIVHCGTRWRDDATVGFCLRTPAP